MSRTLENRLKIISNCAVNGKGSLRILETTKELQKKTVKLPSGWFKD